MISKKRKKIGYNERYISLGLDKIEEMLEFHKVPKDLTAKDMFDRAEKLIAITNKKIPKNTKKFKLGHMLEHISWNEYGYYKWNCLKALLICREKLRKQKEIVKVDKLDTFAFSEKIKYGA
jgi:hypothetical protein